MLQQLSSTAGMTWFNISEPEPDELAQFVRETKLEPADAEFVVQNFHRPEISVRNNYILILIYVPTFDRQHRVTKSAPLYIVATAEKLWTVHYDSIVVLAKLLEGYENSAEKREEYFADGPLALALHIVGHLYSSSFRKLERLSKHVNIVEDAVFQGNERKMVEEITTLMRDVMDFRKIVRAQNNLFDTPPQHPLATELIRHQWRRLHGQVQKMWDFLESLYESTKELSVANSNLLQHKENEILRVLTYYSIIAIPVWILITPIDPLDSETPLWIGLIFWTFLASLIALLLVIFVFFKKKRVL